MEIPGSIDIFLTIHRLLIYCPYVVYNVLLYAHTICTYMQQRLSKQPDVTANVSTLKSMASDPEEMN
jgi:hypothetical protein